MPMRQNCVANDWLVVRRGARALWYPDGAGLRVDALHGLGAGVDGVSQFLFQTAVTLRQLTDADKCKKKKKTKPT